MKTETHDTQQVLIMHADDAPLTDVVEPSPNHRYRYPSLSLQQRDLRQLEDNYVRLNIEYAGICGTDVHLVKSNPDTGYVLTSAPASIPRQGRVIGHEAVGRVIDTGNGVSHVKAGDYVAIASVIHCMYCAACRRGAFNQCHKARLLGMEVDGIFGNTVDIPASLAHDISDQIESEDDVRAFACLEPAATAMLACETAKITAGNSVVVFGGGPIGLLAAIIAKCVMGAAKVTLVEPLTFRRELARQWVDEVFAVDEFLVDHSSNVDIVIEASGQLTNISRIFRRINPNGHVVLLARSGEPMQLDCVDHMITQAITISACRGHLGGFLGKVVSLYKSGRLPVKAVITGTVDGLDGLLNALSDTDAIVSNHCKLLVKF